MEPLSLSFIVLSCSGECSQGDGNTIVRRICTDTRQVEPGDLFVALSGDRFDGHNFLAEAAQKGAAAFLVDQSRARSDWPSLPTIQVKDTRIALGKLAAAYRKMFQPAMVAVCGSNGKTTTKEALACVLRSRMKTLWSEASFNNDIGVPHTLLRLDKSHQAAVLEVGTNHPGELAPLLQMIQARYGIITSIGREHLEFFGNLEGVVREEGTLAEILPVNGHLFVNGDSPQLDNLLARAKCPVTTVGFGVSNRWRVSHVRVEREGTFFKVDAPQEAFSGEYQLPLWGRHQAVNALLVLATCAELQLSPEECRAGLAQCVPARMRLQMSQAHGITFLDDTYNANADSMLAALSTLRELPCSGKRVAVLGDMEELGETSHDAHTEVGQRAAESQLGQLFTVGRWAKVMAESAQRAGLSQARDFTTIESAAETIKASLKAGDVVLLKASRATQLERLSNELRSCSTT